ncbi:hypothetical protein T265_09113 [Opisthorchis viverrini]|uniref:Reverse transcriptase domain-containing protein n=1 Tax=Opisthorchis viverrini TaxID=6198 RepID=A0A074ZHW7_OPIVI|nr:hypothetical protein T265_09113 [Opisthorchis viverrini]KER22880.1 hypothetical protein T265_09113 [Opisthorchis viverrini]
MSSSYQSIQADVHSYTTQTMDECIPEESKLTFNNQIYRKKNGVAMGSLRGPILSDFFMSKLETQKLEALIGRLTLYRRYVDDIFVLADEAISTTDVLSSFNSVHANIKVTIESEQNGQLSFLDVNVKKKTDGTIQRKVHRKQTWKGQYIHSDSFVPLQQKSKLIRCLTE